MDEQPIDHALLVRQGVVAHLKAYAPLTGLVSAARICGEEPPAKIDWPFIRYGFPITTPYVATRMQGSAHRVTLHAFAHGPFTDSVLKIAAAIVKGMQSLTLETLDLVDLQWVGTNVIRDTDEANGYHAVCDFDLVAVEVE